MDYKKLSEIIFKDITKTPDYYENLYPQRDLPNDAFVTRIAPSPTGFMHIGNLFGAITDERLAKLSNGVFYLRIEDTDLKRTVENGVEQIIEVFNHYGLNFDEGPMLDGTQKGNYGPYFQRSREEIYKTYAKYLVSKGLAYPCFCTEDELKQMREEQQEAKENFGYYGKYAKHRNATLEEIINNLKEEKPYVIRFKSNGNINNKIPHYDLVKGKIDITENDQDIVILKADGIPTYHFAHVIDDYLMRTTHVVRGEEWLATLPIHLQLFQALEIKPPKYIHTAQLMKMDGESKRKLSKRHDPELALSYYDEIGYPVIAVKEYLMTLLNSNYEEWRIKNPTKPLEEFPFSAKKMSVSGSLFDILKLDDVCKNTLSVMNAQEVYDLVLNWAEKYDKEFYILLNNNKEYCIKILSIGRGGKKPRKDIGILSEVKNYMGFFFDELFNLELGAFPQNVSKDNIIKILQAYENIYDENKEQNDWFDDICRISKNLGFAYSTKEYKENPQNFLGHPGDVSMILRVAISARQNSPDMYEVMKILGKDRINKRLEIALELFK